MPSPPAIVQTLPYAAWVMLTALALGAAGFVAITAEATDATRGYLRFIAIAAAILAALAWVADGALPVPDGLAIRVAPPPFDAVRRSALVALAILLVAYAFTLGRRPWRVGLAVAAAAAGGAVVGSAAAGWAPTLPDAIPLAVQLLVLAAVTGGSIAAVALGHWYLVTPKLSTRPLLLQTRLLLAALVVQALLFVVWATLGGGINQRPWDALTGPSALLVWLRGSITVGFPLILGYMAVRTAQTRSMESSTGLLYINLAAVLAGTIGAAALYVSSGTLI